MKRAVILYLATLIVLVPLDFLFLGVLAKDFFKAQVGPALGEINMLPAVIFYLLYPLGIVIFVSLAAGTNWQHALFYGALFGLFCYATFDLTALALLKGKDRLQEVAAGEIRPQRPRDIELRISDLPEQEIADAHFARGAD